MKPLLQPVRKHEIQVGRPLRWNVYDKDHKLLLREGAIVRSEAQLEALGEHGLFVERRGRSGMLREPTRTPLDQATKSSPVQPPPTQGQEVETSFATMKLHVGETLQLQPLGGSEQERYLVKLIGYLDKRSILVTTPADEGQVLFIREGQTFAVRTFSGKKVYNFNANVLRSCTAPYPYLHLSFPATVNGFMVRKATRVKVKLICTAANRRQGEDGVKMPCTLVDLSISGALLDAQKALGEVGDELALSLRMNIGSGDPTYLSLGAVIRSIRVDEVDNAANALIHHGIEFQEMSATDRLVLENFIYKQLQGEF